MAVVGLRNPAERRLPAPTARYASTTPTPVMLRPNTHLAARLALFSAGLAATFSLPASAQSGVPQVRTLIKDGAMIGAETVDDLSEPSIASDGTWACLGSVGGRRAVIANRELLIGVGDTTLDGSTVEEIVEIAVSADGSIAVLLEAENSADPFDPISELRIGSSLVLTEGGTIALPSLGTSATILGISGMDYDHPKLAVAVTFQIPSGPFGAAFVVGDVASGVFTATGGIATDDALPGSTSGRVYFGFSGASAVTPAGAASHRALVRDGGDLTSALFSGGNVFVEGGEAGPEPNTVWSVSGEPRIRTNSFGSTIYSAALTGGMGQTQGVIYQDGVRLAREGDNLGGNIGVIGDFAGGQVAVAQNGMPFFSVPLSLPGREVLMAGGNALLRSGPFPIGTGVGLERIESLLSGSPKQQFDVTPDGRSVVQAVQFMSGSTAIVLAELPLGDPATCMTEVNSTGVSGEIEATGSRFLSINDLSIVATELPLNSFGYLGISNGTFFVPMTGGSSGNLCIGPTVGRYVDQVQSSDTTGRISTDINLDAIPQPSGSVASTPGDTWYCQLWHRDVGPSGPTSNFTAAIGVTVQ